MSIENREKAIEQPKILLLEENYNGKRHSAVSIKERLGDLSSLQNVVVADIPVTDMQEPEELWVDNDSHALLGYRDKKTGLVNIDHHAENPDFYRVVTATELACLYVTTAKDAQQRQAVITHTDADSILASAVLAGILPPEKRFVDAANSADHTGVDNDIADLLSAAAPKHDVSFSLHLLQTFLEGSKPLPEEIQKLILERKEIRKKAKQLVEEGMVQDRGEGVWTYSSAGKMNPLFLRPFLPQAKVITSENTAEEGKINIVAGQQFPEGHSLLTDAGLKAAGFHGRWGNARNRVKPGRAGEINVEQAIGKVKEFLLLQGEK